MLETFLTILEYVVSIVCATVVVVVGTKSISSRFDQVHNYFDPEGNSASVNRSAVRWLSTLCAGIAGAYKAPSIITALAEGIAKVIAAAQ